MRTNRVVSSALAGCWALLAVVLSCSSSVEPLPEELSEYDELRRQIALSPRADEEAELMALWMSGDVVADERDYQRVLSALQIVRETFRDSVPYLDSVKFTYDTEYSKVIVLLSDEAVSQLRSNSYTDWDSLNELFRVEDIDTTGIEHRGEVTLEFEGRLNPSLLGPIYYRLPSITGYGVYVPGDDYSNIYPWIADHDHTFLLRRAWGDCSRWCTENQLWYFKVRDGEPIYVGRYYSAEPQVWPEWWEEASVSLCTYILHADLCRQP